MAGTNQRKTTGVAQGLDEPRTQAARRPSHDEIAKRAFEIYLSRGEWPGRDVEDWLEAERQLRNRLCSQADANPRLQKPAITPTGREVASCERHIPASVMARSGANSTIGPNEWSMIRQGAPRSPRSPHRGACVPFA